MTIQETWPAGANQCLFLDILNRNIIQMESGYLDFGSPRFDEISQEIFFIELRNGDTMETDIYCVFCGSPLFSRPKASVPAGKVRQAVANGFSPDKSALVRIAGQMGMSLKETRQAFLDDVQGLDSDWIICQSCARRIENYRASFLGIHMNPKIAAIIMVVLVILMISLLYSMEILK
jgi:hypothetical protein